MMFKVMSAFALPEGTDPEEFWKYHTKIHAEDVKKAAGPSLKKLKKYVVNRVTNVVEGDAKYFGIVEMWWDNAEALQEYVKVSRNYKTASGKSPMDDFLSRVKPVWSIEMEEANISLS